jgi:hypothetical protein
MNSNDREYFNSSQEYNSTYLKYDLYVLFIEKGLKILKKNCTMGYIIPSVILSIPYGKIIRENIVKENTLNQIIDFSGFKVFNDAMVETCILIISKEKNIANNIKTFKPKVLINDFSNNCVIINQKKFIETDSFQFRLELNINSQSIIDKIKKNSISLESIYYVSKGIVAFSKVDNRIKDDFLFESIIDEKCKPYLEGKDVHRYNINFEKKYLQYDSNIMSRPTFPELHENNKILIRAISDGLNGTFDNNGYFIDQKLIICSKRYEIEKFIIPAKRPKSEHLNKENIINDLSTLALINSKLYKFYYSIMLKGGVSILPEDIRNFPIFHFNKQNQQPFIEKADLMLTLNKDLQEVSLKFSKYFSGQFKLEKLSGKLEKWYDVTFEEFIKEINKAIKAQKGTPLTKKDEFDWIDLFEENKVKANKLQNEINTTDKEIDAMVYELYGLTKEEIEIVENS